MPPVYRIARLTHRATNMHVVNRPSSRIHEFGRLIKPFKRDCDHLVRALRPTYIHVKGMNRRRSRNRELTVRFHRQTIGNIQSGDTAIDRRGPTTRPGRLVHGTVRLKPRFVAVLAIQKKANEKHELEREKKGNQVSSFSTHTHTQKIQR